MKPLNEKIILSIFAFVVFFLSFSMMYALPPTTIKITNTAEAVYIDPDNGNILHSLSNTIVIKLIPVSNVRLEANLKQVVAPGEQLYLPHTLSNLGNIVDSYTLSLSNVAGDDADLDSLALYYDKNANGLLDKGEVKVSEVRNLHPNKVMHLVITGTVPIGISNGMLITLKLSASSLNKEVHNGQKLVINTDSLFISGTEGNSNTSKNETSIRFLTPTADALKGNSIPDFYQPQDFIDAQQYRIEPESSNNYDPVRDGIYVEIHTSDIETVYNKALRHLEPIKMVSLVSTATGDSLKIAIREITSGSGIYRSIRPIRLSKTSAGKGVSCPSNPEAYQEVQPDYSKDAPECVLRSVPNDKLRVTVSAASSTTVVDTAVVEPLGKVFDSSTLKGVSGMRVRFMTANYHPAIDTMTGLVLPEQATDSEGQFQFPSLAAGKYYLKISGKEDLYQFPSSVSPSKFSQFKVSDYSYGESGFNASGLFTVTAKKPTLTIDIPIDPITTRLGQHIAISKQTSQSSVIVGDTMTYMVTVANHTGEVLNKVQVHDLLPQGFHLLNDTVRVEGEIRKNIMSQEASSLIFELGELADGSEVILRYSVRITAHATKGGAIASSYVVAYTAEGNRLTSGITHTKVIVSNTGILASQGIVFGKVHFDKRCGYKTNHENALLPLGGVHIYLDDGRYAITDASGDYTFYALAPELHTVKIDTLTLPEGISLKLIDTQQANDARSYFIDLTNDSFHRADFILDCLKKNTHDILSRVRAKNTSLPDMDFLTEPGFIAAADHNATKIIATSHQKKPTFKNENKMLVSKQVVKKITYKQAKKGTWLWPKNNISIDGRFMVAIQSGVKEPILFVNGEAISIEKMGEQLINKKSRGQVLAWYGINLKEGENKLEVRGIGPRGKMRSLAQAIFKRPSRGVSINITPLKDVFVADGGKSSLPLKVSILDHMGYPAIGDYFLTIEASDGTWLEPDIQDAKKGHQVKISNGKGIIHLLSSSRTGEVKISVKADALSGETAVTQTAYLRPLFITGYLKVSASSTGSSKSRAKFFMKGKVLGDKHLTLSFDSNKKYSGTNDVFDSEVKNTFYPLKGEASVSGFAARSRNKVFAKLEKGKKSILYGNYTPDAFSTDDLAGVSRTLTGVKTNLDLGKTQVQSYAAYERDTRIVEEFRGNGTASNYQLKNSNLVVGSELVELIVRDRNNRGLLVSTQILQHLTDYTLDTQTGYLSFHRVIPSLDDKLNPVYLRITYNQESNGKRYLVAGAQIAHQLDDKIKVGASYNTDNHHKNGNRIAGVYLNFTNNKKDNLSVSAARMLHNNGETSGNAYRIKGIKHWSDDSTTNLSIARADKGFTNSNGVLADRQELKLSHHKEFNKDSSLNLEATHSESLSSHQTNQTIEAKVQTRQGKWLLESGARHIHQRLDDVDETTDTVLLGAKRSVKVFEKNLSLGVNYEQDIRNSTRNHTTATANIGLTKDTSVYANYESGTDFTGELGSGHDIHSNRLVAGIKNKLSPSMEAYSEHRIQDITGSNTAETSSGIRGSIEAEKDLTVTPALEVVKVSRGDTLQDSVSASVSIKDIRDRNNKKYLRVEARKGESDDYYAVEGNYIKRLDDIWSAYIGEKLRINDSDKDGLNGNHELTLGLAQRQRDEGKHNGLYMYQWKENKGVDKNSDTNTHILSTHQNYQVNEDIAVSGRAGGKIQTSHLEGQDYQTNTILLDTKASYALNDKVDVYARGGLITSNNFNESHYSGGIGANFTIDRNLRVGIGYNKQGFKEVDLDPDKQNKEGFFMSLILKADENMFDWLDWKKKKRVTANDGIIDIPIPKTSITFDSHE